MTTATNQPSGLLTFLYPMLLRSVARSRLRPHSRPIAFTKRQQQRALTLATRPGTATRLRIRNDRLGSSSAVAQQQKRDASASASASAFSGATIPTRQISAGFHTSALLRDDSTRPQRYGVSVEPHAQSQPPPPLPPHLSNAGKVGIGSLSGTPSKPEETKKETKEEDKKDKTTTAATSGSEETPNDTEEGDVTPDQHVAPDSPILIPPSPSNNPSSGSTGSMEPRPLEMMLHTDLPSSEASKAQKPPHLQPRPYVHHFDTYSLVRDLEKGGFTDKQCVTLMKAVRGLLAENLTIAKEGLVSKSDVENETYLFRAACSELRTEIQNNRKKETDKMRTERTALQHEVDILNQNFNGELLSLKDDLRGMFDDRRMAVRQEQRAMESKIQELNWQITVLLNSDAKSEVEGLRWILTRRAALAIATMAFLILGSLRYSSYMIHAQERSEKQHLSSSSSSSNSPSSPLPHLTSSSSPTSSISSLSGSSSSLSDFGSPASHTASLHETTNSIGGTETAEVLATLDDGDGRSSYVTLG